MFYDTFKLQLSWKKNIFNFRFHANRKKKLFQTTPLITGLPCKPSHKMGFRSSVSNSGHPGEGKHEGLVRRNDVLTNGFI